MGALLVGLFAGKSITDVVFSRTVLLALVWALVPWTAASSAIAVFHAPAAGYVAGMAAIVAMLLFATTPPFGRVRLALLKGLTIWCGISFLVSVMRVAIHVVVMGPVAGFLHEGRWIAIGMAAVAVAGFAEWRFERSRP